MKSKLTFSTLVAILTLPVALFLSGCGEKEPTVEDAKAAAEEAAKKVEEAAK